jgi:integrase
MSAQNPAARVILEALQAPDLTDAKRRALVLALGAVAEPPAPAPDGDKVPRADRVHLTRNAIAAMPLPPAGERLVYDSQTPQLAVRLRPSGASFIVSMWDRERQRKTTRTLGKCSALTPDKARAEARRIVARVADGEDIRRERDETITVRQLIGMWHDEKGRSTRTADELRDKMLHYLARLADRPARDVQREDVGAIHHQIATKARKRVYRGTGDALQAVETGKAGMPATADKWRGALHAVFAWGQGKGLVAANPCEGIGAAFNAKKAARTNYLRGDSLLSFWRELEADPDADTRDALKLMLFTGQRRGNVLCMRWADVDLTAGVWSLSAAQTKQSKAQTTPLVAQAATILQRRYTDAATGWVFPATRVRKRDGADRPLGAMSESRLRDAWVRICTAAGITDLRPHDLRHTSGSWLARLGASEAVRQKALGHQTPAMAARYSHLELDPVADALQRVANAVEAEATKPAAAVRSFKARAKA